MPKITLRKLIRLFRNLMLGWIPGGRCVCVMCGHQVWGFTPYRDGFQVPLMNALGFVSGDMSRFGCPRCGCHDRERHLKLFLSASGVLESISVVRVLHFAPEMHLGRWIQARSPASYVPCDLYPASQQIQKVDIENIPYEDGSFDLVIANHVLEHVDNDARALAEITRVLSMGGLAVLQTPFSPVLTTTWSDAGIVSREARLHAYGQEDHVRLYGRDIFDRFASEGLRSCVRTHAELLAHIEPQRFGVGVDEPFFLFKRTS